MFRVIVVPRASRSGIAGEHGGRLKVRLAAPPVDGAANRELIRLISKLFRVPKGDVEIVSGAASRSKTLTVRGGTIEMLNRALK